MKAAQRLVAQIRGVIETGKSPGDVDAASIAAEYSQLCSTANERLRLCKRYLSKGMLSEAMHVAEAKPVLLDLCGILDFIGVEEWTDICTRNGWAVPERIDAGAVTVLNEHYSSAMVLEPTIKKYRRAVRENDTSGCIRLLRQILVLDPDNRNWEQDLRAFEKTRLSEIQTASQAAAKKGDSATLSGLLREIDDDWLVEPDPQLREAVQAAYRTLRELETAVEGRRVVSAISDAYSALDFERLQSRICEYEALLTGGYFIPDASTLTQFDEANEWFLAEKARRDADRAYEDDLKALKTELNRDRPRDELQRIWMSLVAHRRDIPEDLAHRAQAAIETIRILAVRKKRRVLLATVCACFAVVSCILGVVWRWQYLKEEAYWCGELEAAFEGYDLADFREILSEIPEYRPTLFGSFLASSESVQGWAQREEELELRVQERTASFNERRAVLDVIREQDFQEDADRLTALSAEAQRLAIEDEHGEFVRQFQQDWRTHGDSAVETLTRRLTLRMPTIVAFETNAFPLVAAQVRAMRETLDEARAVKGASPATYQRLTTFDSEVAEMESAVARRRPRYAAATNAQSAVAYMEALTLYSTEFPSDHLSRTAEEVVAVGAESYRQCLQVWQQQEQRLRQQGSEIKDRWASVRTAVSALGDDDALCNIRYFTYKDVASTSPKVYFLQGAFTEAGGSIRRYKVRGRMYVPTPRDTMPVFREFTVERTIAKTVSPVFHCRLLTSILKDLNRIPASNARDFMCSKIVELAAAPVWDGESQTALQSSFLNHFLKLKLLRFFCERAIELEGSDVLPELEMAVKDMRAAEDTSVDWLCIENPQVLTVVDRNCAGVLRQHFADCDWLLRSRISSLAERLAAERGVEWVGTVDPCASSNILWRGGEAREAWVLRQTSSGEAALRIATLESENGRHSISVPLLPYEPLLGPADGSSTAEAFSRLMAAADTMDAKVVSALLPENWPSDGQTDDSGRPDTNHGAGATEQSGDRREGQDRE